MSEISFKRLILRAVLRDVYPMVIRLVAVPDYLELGDFDDVFHAVLGLGWRNRLHVPGPRPGVQQLSPPNAGQAPARFCLRRQEKFQYTLGAVDQWEWELRVIDQQTGAHEDHTPVCVGGRGATPPQLQWRPDRLSADVEAPGNWREDVSAGRGGNSD